MEARQSSVEEMLEAQSETMDELRQQQEEVMRQVVLAEHKPAWDDALRIVVDVAFDFGSSLPEVSEVGPDAYGYSLSTLVTRWMHMPPKHPCCLTSQTRPPGGC